MLNVFILLSQTFDVRIHVLHEFQDWSVDVSEFHPAIIIFRVVLSIIMCKSERHVEITFKEI